MRIAIDNGRLPQVEVSKIKAWVKANNLTHYVFGRGGVHLVGVDKCPNCGHFCTLPNSLTIESLRGEAFAISLGLTKIEYDVDNEADVTDDGDECCTDCRHTLDG